MKLLERFWSNVNKTETCWLWTGPTSGSTVAYGVFSFGSKNFLAHRVSYELEVDQIKPSHSVLHHCDRGLCVRPDHLFTGTQKDNIHDMLAKGRFTPPYGEKCGTSKLTWEQVAEIRQLYGPVPKLPGQRRSLGLAELGRRYGVSAPTIHSIVHHKKWIDRSGTHGDSAAAKRKTPGGFIR